MLYEQVRAVVRGNIKKLYEYRGIPNLYQIYINWKGTNRIINIKARKLTVSTTSALKDKKYYDKPLHINCDSTTLGYKSIGTVMIPTSTKQVRIKTTGLQCYFNDADYWISTGNINGLVSVN